MCEFFKEIARKQVNAGADMLDVNGGLPGQELEVLPWLVNIVQETVSVPLCLDSADPEALRRALPLCKQRAMINSITDEPARIAALLPVLKEFRPKVIALCMGEAGPPNTAEERVAQRQPPGGSADRGRISRSTTSMWMAAYCRSAPVPSTARRLLDAVGQITARYPGVHASAGVSNVSFGLPLRKLLNETFAVLLMARGLDAGIVDPCDPQLMANIRAAEALLGRDEYCANYLRAFREGKLELPTAA